jgi:hypothetical protein
MHILHLKLSDITFTQHPTIPTAKIARVNFNNGYGVSLVTGDDFFYCDDERPYEAAVLKDDELCYDTYLTSDVLGWQTAEDVEELLKKVSEL